MSTAPARASAGAHAVGIVADEPSLAPNHGVDRPDPGGQVVHRVQVRHDGDLVGNGHADPLNVQGPDGGHCRGRIRNAKGQVDPVEAFAGKGPVVHGRAQAVGHRVADDAI